LDRQALVREAEEAARRARHNLRWIRKHPDRIDPEKRADMEAYLRKLIRFAREEKRNARRAGRLTMDERIVVLRFAVEENRNRWERRLTE